MRWAVPSAALAACLLLLLAFPGLLGPRADHHTGTAELHEIQLQDGSRITLAPRTALDVSFHPERRRVTMLDGEALFDVAADRSRPFVVKVAEVEIVVVGTSFEVRLSDRQIAVAVREGIVEWRRDGEAVRLTAGDRLVLDRASNGIRRNRVDLADIAAWRDGTLFVDGATVGEVIDELARYAPGWIVVPDRNLARQRVTGFFDLRDTDRALDALVKPFGGRVYSATPWVRVATAP